MVGDNMIYSFNFSNMFDKKNGKKLVILGVIMLAIGVYCLTKKSVGIKVFSWGLSIIFLYGAWLNLKSLNELTRYASKIEIRNARFNLLVYFIIALLLLVFPKYINMLLSTVLGVYLIYKEILIFLGHKRYGVSRYSIWNVLKLFIGVLLIVSPLYLSKFLVSILSIIIIIFGINFITNGIRLINEQGY